MLAELAAVEAAFVSVGVWPVEDTVLEDENGGLVRRNYVLLFPELPDAVSERYLQTIHPDGRIDVDVSFKAVGTSRAAVKGWMGRVWSLTGARLSVPGRQCSPVEVGTEQGLQFDNAVKPGLFFVDGWVRFTSRPA